MSNYKSTKPQAEVPDLLAALTAHGLSGPDPMAHEDHPAKQARRWWLARWLEPRQVSHGPAPASLDDEWAGACYARSRRLLGAALKR